MVDGVASKPPTPSKRVTPPYHRVKKLSGESSDSLGSSTRDPPRPAKEGFEWVWFPEGYWAERELPSGPRKASDGSVTRLWKWKSQSSKSKSSSDDQRGLPLSPMTLHTPPAGGVPFVPSSPYLSEEAHVHSLQNRSGLRHERSSSIGSRTDRAGAKPVAAPLREPDGELQSDSPLSPTSAPRPGLWSTARKGFSGTLLKGKTVRIPNSLADWQS